MYMYQKMDQLALKETSEISELTSPDSWYWEWIILVLWRPWFNGGTHYDPTSNTSMRQTIATTKSHGESWLSYSVLPNLGTACHPSLACLQNLVPVYQQHIVLYCQQYCRRNSLLTTSSTQSCRLSECLAECPPCLWKWHGHALSVLMYRIVC